MPPFYKKFILLCGILLVVLGIFGFGYVFATGLTDELWPAGAMFACGLFFVIFSKITPNIDLSSLQKSPYSTTKIEFKYTKSDFFDIADAWAEQNGFTTKNAAQNSRLYEKGNLLSWNAHPSVEISITNNKALIIAWINPIFGGRADISSANYFGAWAKIAARESVNKLLSKFKQKPIE